MENMDIFVAFGKPFPLYHKHFYTPVLKKRDVLCRGVVRPSIHPSVHPSVLLCPAYYFYTVEDIDAKLGINDHQHMILCAPKKEVAPYLFSRVMPLLRLKKCDF